MEPVAPWNILHSLAVAAAVLRHVAEPLNKRAMHPAQLPAAPETFLLHQYCYSPNLRQRQKKVNNRRYYLFHFPKIMLDRITVHGARQHNLKNIDVEIPRNSLTVITGLSGSGKSSLAFDTIYAEGQRRYVETLSTSARQFLDQMERPDVDSIDGLSPAISIEQKTTSRSPR